MAAWQEFRLALARLIEERPGAVTLHPDLDGDGGTPPYQVGLAPWAEVAGPELHERFGDLVDLTVGALPYPPGGTPRWQSPRPQRVRRKAARPDLPVPPRPPGEPAALLDPAEADAGLDGPAVVSSGHTLQHGLLLRNHTSAELAIATNGRVTAVVVDPRSGEVVGGYAGFQTLPLVIFRVPPGGTERIPLLIGTASFTERLGYTVPPGSWGIQVPLNVARGRIPDPALPLRHRVTAQVDDRSSRLHPSAETHGAFRITGHRHSPNPPVVATAGWTLRDARHGDVDAGLTWRWSAAAGSGRAWAGRACAG